MFGVSNSNELWISFKDELSAQEIKIDIVKSGTDIPVAGNYRFRWLDIDLYQRFGINLQNGSIGHRYATTDSVVNVVKKTLFSKNFEVLTAPAPAVDGEIPQNTVVYELDNSSGFYLAILRPGCGAYSIETAKQDQSVFADVQTGTCKTSAGLNWDAKGYGPVEYPGLVKRLEIHWLPRERQTPCLTVPRNFIIPCRQISRKSIQRIITALAKSVIPCRQESISLVTQL